MLKKLSSALLLGLLVACAGSQSKPDDAMEAGEEAVEAAEAPAQSAEGSMEAANEAEHAMEEAHAEAAEELAAVETEMGMLYGAVFEAGEPVALATLVASPESYKGQDVIVEGPIRQVCQKMGCWLELATAPEAEMGVRVVSKDHNIFVPKDCAGKTATIKGTLEVKEVTEEMAEHYRSEGAEAEAGMELTLYMTGIALK